MAKRRFKRVLLFMAALLATSVFSISAGAYSPAVKDIAIHVSLDEDGSAAITEVWDVTVASGTEWYLKQGNLGDIRITDFRVSDETGAVYEDIGTWDIDKSLEEKAGKSGMVNTGDGYELCWGVGSYGDHRYTVQYTMTNFVKSMNDYDAFNNRLINDQLSSPPQHISVTIEKPGTELTLDDTRMWAFGFEGHIELSDGRIIAYSDGPLDEYDYVTIMVRFNKGLFLPTSVRNEPFSVMEERAKEGSDYDSYSDYDDYSDYDSYSDYRENLEMSMVRIFSFSVFIFFVGGAIYSYRKSNVYYYKKQFGFPGNLNRVYIKKLNYSREIPLGGDIPMALYLLNQSGVWIKDRNIIGAYLLRWHNLKAVNIRREDAKGVFSSEAQVCIYFYGEYTPENPAEKELYHLLRQAAGADGVLREKELNQWASNYYREIYECLQELKSTGVKFLMAMRKAEPNKGNFMVPYRLNREGVEEAIKLLGFKKYLTDFTIINERQPAEVELWDTYLIFAMIFGIAKKVSKEFKQLYPDYFMLRGGENVDYMTTVYAISSLTSSYSRGVVTGKTRSSGSDGSGGSSSSGGGGGSSGGGSGGGSR